MELLFLFLGTATLLGGPALALSILAKRFLPRVPSWLRIVFSSALVPTGIIVFVVWAKHDCAIRLLQNHLCTMSRRSCSWELENIDAGCQFALQILPIFAVICCVTGLAASLLHTVRK
jgi:hypothetical protein